MSQRRKSRGRVPLFFWIILALLALALAYRVVRPGAARARQTQPRPGIGAARMASPGGGSRVSLR